MVEKRIAYIYDESLIQECDRLPAVRGRASMVHELIESYDLLDKMHVVKAEPASYEDLQEFHSTIYLDHIKELGHVDEDYQVNDKDEENGIAYDCEPVDDLYKLIQVLAGGSITAAKTLTDGIADVAINWCGGWHHAQRFEAEGFCYVNDIVIAIEKLRRTFPKVLYVDLDVHHGNGVQNAYEISKNVFTLSLHKYEAGFYPGSGGINDIGSYHGVGYSCNFPFREGVSDEAFCNTFHSIFSLVCSRFDFDAVVVQCGADCLAGDPLGGANLTPEALCRCVQQVRECGKPTLLLGGGGYNLANAARLWSSITGQLLDIDLSAEIPDHRHFLLYGPGYDLTVYSSSRKDCNDKEYLDNCIAIIQANIAKYVFSKNNL